MSLVAVAELPEQLVELPEILPVKFPSTSPLRLPLMVLVNLAEPVTNKESVVKLSISVSLWKVVLLLKIFDPEMVCSVSVVTIFGFPVTLPQATDFVVLDTSAEVACSTSLIVTVSSLPSDQVNVRAAPDPDTLTTAGSP